MFSGIIVKNMLSIGSVHVHSGQVVVFLNPRINNVRIEKKGKNYFVGHCCSASSSNYDDCSISFENDIYSSFFWEWYLFFLFLRMISFFLFFENDISWCWESPDAVENHSIGKYPEVFSFSFNGFLRFLVLVLSVFWGF